MPHHCRQTSCSGGACFSLPCAEFFTVSKGAVLCAEIEVPARGIGWTAGGSIELIAPDGGLGRSHGAYKRYEKWKQEARLGLVNDGGKSDPNGQKSR